MLIINIKAIAGTWNEGRVAGAAMAQVPIVENAYLLIENGVIADFGAMVDCPQWRLEGDVVDASGCFVIPAFCDSHTHLVYAAARDAEWQDRLQGLSYEDIARRGGGILNSVDRLREASEEQLLDDAMQRCQDIMRHGTGAVEIKSGYGLDLNSELKMLRVIGRLAQSLPLTVRATFLAAHAVPREYVDRQQQYVDLICTQMLPAVVAQGVADFVDVFCDDGFFTLKQTEQILEASAKYGLKGKIHANELAASGGVELACAMECLSADHLERMNDAAFDALVDSQRSMTTNRAALPALPALPVMPTALPAASFFLGIPYTPLRAMIDRGLAVALASDYNPGSAPSGNMQLVGTLACIGSSILPLEAFTASTVNSAAAMGLADHGRIARLAVANVCITKPMDSLAELYYNFGCNNIARTILRGAFI